MGIQKALDLKKSCEANRENACSGVEGVVEQAKDLALCHSFVTPLTSLVVVKPDQGSQVEELERAGEYSEGGGHGRYNTKMMSAIPAYDSYDSYSYSRSGIRDSPLFVLVLLLEI